MVTSIYLVVLLGYLTHRIIQPFLILTAWAVVFSIVLYPVYEIILIYVRCKVVSSIVTLLILILLILGPFTYLSFILTNEIGNFIEGIDQETTGSVKDILSNPTLMKLVCHGAAGEGYLFLSLKYSDI
jgi:predicted PurR-regulated permease PerM